MAIVSNTVKTPHIDIETLKKSLALGEDFLLSLQKEDGSWEGEMIWNPMITSQYIFLSRITGQKISEEYKEGFLQLFKNWQRNDGSWGMHDESHGYMFITLLVYVALRFLGEEADSKHCQKARQWIRENGGAVSVPTWGKLWLAVVNLYDWSGINPILPELWLQPAWSPVHPRRFYCHTRLIYLPIGVLCAKKFQSKEDDLIRLLREEIYLTPYREIKFSKHRNNLFATDIFAWPTKVTLIAYEISRLINKITPRFIRKQAIKACFRRMRFELKSTGYACISPVNGLLNALAIWTENPDDPDFKKAYAKTEHWLWKDGPDGYRYTGARSHVWDTSFVMQTAASGVSKKEWIGPAKRALSFYENHQILKELPEHRAFFREPLLGGFCFSDVYHQWPVSDCTAEALSGLHGLKEITGECLPEERLVLAAKFILKRQNKDGGFGSYEPRRGNWLLELLNPSEMYGNCMLEHSYIECTASCIHGLTSFLKMVPKGEKGLSHQVHVAIEKGVKYLRHAQSQDGSWAGFWGVNYTYGTLFGIMGLVRGGGSKDDPAIRRAVSWLYDHQLADGGWGEDWHSCLEGRYMPTEKSQVIQTAWALMALALAGEDEGDEIKKGVGLLLSRQMKNGDFPKEGQSGVFFNTAMLHYMLYKNYFPLWAMGSWIKRLS